MKKESYDSYHDTEWTTGPSIRASRVWRASLWAWPVSNRCDNSDCGIVWQEPIKLICMRVCSHRPSFGSRHTLPSHTMPSSWWIGIVCCKMPVCVCYWILFIFSFVKTLLHTSTERIEACQSVLSRLDHDLELLNQSSTKTISRSTTPKNCQKNTQHRCHQIPTRTSQTWFRFSRRHEDCSFSFCNDWTVKRHMGKSQHKKNLLWKYS